MDEITLAPALAELLAGDDVTDVLLNGCDETWVDGSSGLRRLEASPFATESELQNAAIDLVASAGRHLDAAHPFADVALPGGLRLHAALASACSERTLVSIRKHQSKSLCLEDLCEQGMLTVAQASLLRRMVERRESFLISGASGSGKTTLLRLVEGLLQPNAGRVKLGKTVKIATLSQEVKELQEFYGDRIFQLLAREKTTFVTAGGKEFSPSQLIEQLGFDSAQLQTPIEDLSGGQKRRLQFMRLLMGEPNVLILDEPTNDLDTDMLAAMEDLLDSWPGTLIVVTHDRYLLERVTDMQYALLGDGHLRHLPGGVDEYLKLRRLSLTPSKSDKVQSAPTEALSGAEKRDAEKNVSRIERALEKLSNEETELHAQMAAHDQSDYEGLAKLAKQQQELNEKRENLELEWLETTERLS